MTIWNINVIGEQSLDITNGDKHIYHERDWLSGEGVYEKMLGYEIPTLIDLWKEIEKEAAIEELNYSVFTITKYNGGFHFKLESGYQSIVSDETAKEQDLLSFLEMLGNIAIKENKEGGSLSDHEKLMGIFNSLDNAIGEEYEA